MREELTVGDGKRAFVTGITGQDGAYLAQLLLSLGYEVYGGHRRSSTPNFWRLEALGVRHHPRFHLEEHDLTDLGNTTRVLEQIEPDEVYNLAAQSFVRTSFHQPETTAQITGLGALRLLESIRQVNPRIKFYQASSSEMFGRVEGSPQDEQTPFHPRTPYGLAKLYAHWIATNYRESYGIFACSGIMFNHESPLRGPEFVTRKITQGLAAIVLGKQSHLELGNLDVRRDWGYAGDYVYGMWRMLQQPEPDTYVLGTGKATSVREFVVMAARAAGLDIEWRGAGVQEVGVNAVTGAVVVRINPDFYRPTEVDLLLGNAAKARRELGWEPKVQLPELCAMMVREDLRRCADGKPEGETP